MPTAGKKPGSLKDLARDRTLIYGAAISRSAGVGFTSAVLAVYLDKRGYAAPAIGAIVASGLAGGAVATSLVAFLGDRLGRRRMLMALALLGLAAALVPLLGYRTLWTLYAGAVGAGLLLYPGLTEGVELAEPSRPVSPESRRRVGRFAALSAVDSLGSGFITVALIAFYLYKRFGIDERQIAGLFLAADLANIASNFIAERLARWLGLVNTMVFTHIPANLLLIALAFCPTFPVAAAVFLLRELFIEMDVPTRQSYLASIVRPDERTAALGGVQLTRTAMWAVAPGAAGWMMRSVALASPLYIGSSIKIAYDVLLWRAFRHLEPGSEVP